MSSSCSASLETSTQVPAQAAKPAVGLASVVQPCDRLLADLERTVGRFAWELLAFVILAFFLVVYARYKTLSFALSAALAGVGLVLAAPSGPGLLVLVGLVVELGCGSGLLTKHLVDAGHRVIATDASPPMLDIAREYAGAVQEIRRLTLPDDPIPDADAIVSVGHVVNYLPDADALERALVAMAEALRPDGLLAIDICDLSYGEARSAPSTGAWVADDWAIITERSVPSPDRFVRQMAIFMKNEDGSWRRDDERHAARAELAETHGGRIGRHRRNPTSALGLRQRRRTRQRSATPTVASPSDARSLTNSSD